MACLEPSWILEERLNKTQCSEELKNKITIFIIKNHDECTGKRMNYANIYYRNNLHHIEDNINKVGLIDELREYNSKF